MKIGDGVTPWLSLGWSTMSGPDVQRAMAAAEAIEQAGTPTDAVMATQIATPSSATRQALNDTVGAQIEGAVGATSQRAALRLSAGGSESDGTSAVPQMLGRVPFKFPISPKRVRLHARNVRNSFNEQTITGSFPCNGVYLGRAALDATGAPTPTFPEAPRQVLAPFAFPADGSEVVSDWIDVDGFAEANAFMLLSFSINVPAGQARSRSVGRMWWSSTTTDPAALSINSPASTEINLDWWMEYEYDDITPHVLFIGDSLTWGTGSTWPGPDGYAVQAAARTGVACTNAAFHGSSIQNGWLPAQVKWGQIRAITRPQMIDLGLGSNDLNNGRTLAQLQADYGTLLARLRAEHPGVPIMCRTIMPRGFDEAKEGARLAFNAWIKTRPFGIAGVIDITGPVTNPASPTALLAAFAHADNVHLNTEGYRVTAERFAPLGRANSTPSDTLPPPPPPPLPSVPVSISDDFTRADSTISAGPLWTALGGVFGVRSNAAYLVSGASPAPWHIAVTECRADGTVAVDIVTTAAGTNISNAGLVFRATDRSNYLSARLTSIGAVNVHRVEGGVSTQIFSGPATYANPGTAVLSADLAGNSIILKVDGVTVATLTEAFNASATRHGLWGVSVNANVGWAAFSFVG